MSCSRVSVVPSQRSFPQASVQRSSAGAESQVGMWTPLVTCPTGTSSSGQRGNRGRKRRRLTFPCKRLTPLTAPLPRIARYAMLKGSDESFRILAAKGQQIVKRNAELLRHIHRGIAR
jgi:hypothetical protein